MSQSPSSQLPQRLVSLDEVIELKAEVDKLVSWFKGGSIALAFAAFVAFAAFAVRLCRMHP